MTELVQSRVNVDRHKRKTLFFSRNNNSGALEISFGW